MSRIAQQKLLSRPLPSPSALALLLGLSGALAACSGDGDKASTDGGDSVAEDAGDSHSDAGGAHGDAGGAHGDAGDAIDAGVPDTPQTGLTIKLDDGQLQGDMAGDARRFLSIPFAKPPLGDLRWKAPVPAEPWSGVRHETDFPKSCAQLADQGAPASDNEDCLYLNVWTPEPAPSKAPVMVWIHGGGNFSGGTGIPLPSVMDKLWYDGQFFASKQGVVLVTIQYRLGPLGFFAHPALGDEHGPVGNQGLLDQVLALKWVKKNIAKFGGDPGNVTIFGESAGSADVCYHVVSPGSRGLFHRAVSESGGCTMGNVGKEETLADIGTQMVAYAKAVGCPEGDGQLACLREKSIPDLLAMAMQPMPGAGGGFGGDWSFAAVLDGPDGVLPDSPKALFDRGEVAKVPYLLGSNNDEGTTFVFRADPLADDAAYRADLEKRYPGAATDVYALYPPSDFGGDVNAALARHVGDSTVVCSTHDTAVRAAKAGMKVFMYNFNVAWAVYPSVLKAGHASEISHVFGAPYLPMPDPDSEKVGAAMNHYWATFARKGDPNDADAPAQWPAFTTDADKRLQLDIGWEALDDFRTKECAFWNKYYKLD